MGKDVYSSLTRSEIQSYLKEIPTKYSRLRRMLGWYINPKNGWTKRGEPANIRFWRERDGLRKDALSLHTMKGGRLGKLTLAVRRLSVASPYEAVFRWRVPLK